jgi:O-antigen/teichoic acid export membrane protein
LLIAVAVQNIGNLALHAVLGRALSPAEYGALGTVLSLMVLLTVPLGALQAAASASAARDGGASHARSMQRLAMWSVAAGLVVVLLAPLPMQAFHLDSFWDAAILGPFVTVSVILAVLRGRLLGVRRVGLVAITFLASVAVRLTIALALVRTAPVTGALLATFLGEVVALVIAAVAVRRGAPTTTSSGPWLATTEVVRSGAVIGGLFLFTTIDLFLARHFLARDDSGQYVAAATIAKTLLALPAAALAAAYPRLVAAGRTSTRRAELRRSGIVVIGLAALGSLVVAAVPGLVLAILYGSSYPGAERLVQVLALVAGVSSIVSFATYSLLAVTARSALLPLAGTVLEIALILASHSDALAVARGSAIAAALTSVAMAAALAADVRRPPTYVARHAASSLPV